MDKATAQKLKVKVGVLKRAVKEHGMYTDEVSKLSKELEEMGPDHDKFKQISQALDESKAMILDAHNRVSDAKEAMETFLETETVDENDDLCKEARALVEQASAIAQ